MNPTFAFLFSATVVLAGGWSILKIFTSRNKSEIIISEVIIGGIILFFSIVQFVRSQEYLEDYKGYYFFLVVPTILFVLFFYFFNRFRFKEIDQEQKSFTEQSIRIAKEQKRLKENYDLALSSGNKKDAIIAGRQYYSFLGIYDEQRIQNDLLCFLNTK